MPGDFVLQHVFAVHKDLLGPRLNVMQRIALPDGEVRILADLQGANALVDARDLRRVDGDGAQRVIGVHTGLHRQTRAKRQVHSAGQLPRWNKDMQCLPKTVCVI